MLVRLRRQSRLVSISLVYLFGICLDSLVDSDLAKSARKALRTIRDRVDDDSFDGDVGRDVIVSCSLVGVLPRIPDARVDRGSAGHP